MNINSSFEDKQRGRGPNFSEFEKINLENYYYIRGEVKLVIENKSQNGPSYKEK